MSMQPSSSPPPLIPFLIGGLVLLALAGAAFGAFSGDAAAPSSPTATPVAVVPGGSAWVETPTPVPTWTPTLTPLTTPPATPTPSASASASSAEVGTRVEVCRQQRDGRCQGERDRVDGRFVVILTFDDSSRGDVFGIRVEGPDGEVVDGGSFPIGGGGGYAWSTFAGLGGGEWSAVGLRNGAEVARTDFTVR